VSFVVWRAGTAATDDIMRIYPPTAAGGRGVGQSRSIPRALPRAMLSQPFGLKNQTASRLKACDNVARGETPGFP
jgi:hypothetical protein